MQLRKKRIYSKDDSTLNWKSKVDLRSNFSIYRSGITIDDETHSVKVSEKLSVSIYACKNLGFFCITCLSRPIVMPESTNCFCPGRTGKLYMLIATTLLY